MEWKNGPDLLGPCGPAEGFYFKMRAIELMTDNLMCIQKIVPKIVQALEIRHEA